MPFLNTIIESFFVFFLCDVPVEYHGRSAFNLYSEFPKRDICLSLMLYSDAYTSPILCNDDAKEDKIHELWSPCWYNKLGALVTMYKRFGFLDDFLLGSFFDIDSPGTINALLGFFSHFYSSNVVCWLNCPTVTVYFFDCPQMLTLSLACIILVRGTQKYH